MSRIDDGFKTLITFANFSDVKFWEKNVTPPGFDGGEGNDTTTMHNTKLRTFNPRKLITMTPASFTAAYDSVVYDTIKNMINVNQEITITFPDGSSVKFWGWLKSFTPGSSEEGSQPTADCQIVPSNQNASGVETLPTYTAGAGS